MIKLVAALWENSLIKTNVSVDAVKHRLHIANHLAFVLQGIFTLAFVKSNWKLELENLGVAAQYLVGHVDFKKVNALTLITV